MKTDKLFTTTTLLLLTFSSAHAEAMKCGAGKCGDGMKTGVSKTAAALQKSHSTDGYNIEITSEKPLITGNNTLKITISKDGKPVDAKVKVKFFMPEMPGMPYMESKAKGKTTNGTYNAPINFSMGGTWQYQLKFKTTDDTVHKVRGSVNL